VDFYQAADGICGDFTGGGVKVHLLQADAGRIPLADASVDLVFGSPPYLCARTYGIGAQRGCEEWIDWMLAVVGECCRVSRGLVLINCAGVTRDWCYRPGPEGLLYEWWKRGGQCWRPAYWHRVGIPGSGGKQWIRADVEYVLAFKRKTADGKIPWSDNTANGHPPKWGPVGEMSHRLSSGTRVNQWGPVGGPGAMGAKDVDGTLRSRSRPSHKSVAGQIWGGGGISFGRSANGQKIKPAGAVVRKAISRQHTKSRADGTDEIQSYTPPVLANPGNLISVKVGGGLLGSKLAHLNEAPFPEALAAWFIKGWCPPGGIVLDPFSGSGTTACTASKLGRVGIGADIRFNQCELGRRRFMEPASAKRSKAARPRGEKNLFGYIDEEAA
jgi:hypothetical protein